MLIRSARATNVSDCFYASEELFNCSGGARAAGLRHGDPLTQNR